MEEAEDSFVQFGFNGLQGLGEAGLFGAFFFEIGLPFVGDAWVFQGVGGEFEALFQGFAEGVEGEFPPGFLFLVQGIGAGFAEGLAQILKSARFSRARVMRDIVGPERERAKAHSQMRKTVQPDARKSRVTSRSRCAFRASFTVQKATRVFGVRPWRGQPCQKQPSTNTATFCARKMKSGFPGSGTPRRQPMMRRSRINTMSRSSVARFPRARTRDIRSERSATVSVSVTASFSADAFCSAPRCQRRFPPRSFCPAYFLPKSPKLAPRVAYPMKIAYLRE